MLYIPPSEFPSFAKPAETPVKDANMHRFPTTMFGSHFLNFLKILIKHKAVLLPLQGEAFAFLH